MQNNSFKIVDTCINRKYFFPSDMLVGNTCTREDLLSTMNNSKELQQTLGNSSLEDIKNEDDAAIEDTEAATVPLDDSISLEEGNDSHNRVDLLKNCAKKRFVLSGFLVSFLLDTQYSLSARHCYSKIKEVSTYLFLKLLEI